MSTVVAELLSAIETVRSQLLKLATTSPLTSEEVLSLSAKLDDLVNTYHRILKRQAMG